MRCIELYKHLFAGIAVSLLVASSQGAIVTLQRSDLLGETSFHTGLNWSDGLAPSAGKAYVTNNFRLRTPPNGNSYQFGGDSLTVNNTNGLEGGLSYKGTNNTALIRVENLILDGGTVLHLNGPGHLFQIDGNIWVNRDSTIHAKQGSIQILASISGVGNLIIPATDCCGDENRVVNLLADNSAFTGDIQVMGKLTAAIGSSLGFVIGANEINNSISGSGIGAFNGEFQFNLNGASTNPGDSWSIVSVANKSFGATFSVAGFTKTGYEWTKGAYVFDELTGVLRVVPEPSGLLLLIAGSLLYVSQCRFIRGDNVMIRLLKINTIFLSAICGLLLWLAPTHAGLTMIEDSPDIYDEPNLIGMNPFEGNLNPSVLETLYGELNLQRIDDSRDLYFRYTDAQATAKMVAKFTSSSARFGFTSNDGLFQPVLWASRNDYIGYFPELRAPEILNGVFDPYMSGRIFALRDGTLAWSAPQENYLGLDLMVTFEIIDTIGHPDNAVGSIVVGFEDNPRIDRDYQDLVIEIAGLKPVPEPTLVTLMTLGFAMSVAGRVPYSPRK